MTRDEPPGAPDPQRDGSWPVPRRDDTLFAATDLPRTRISDGLDWLIRTIGDAVSWLWLVLMLIIVTNVTLRYAFGEGRVELEELQWHFYAVGFLFGLSYCMVFDSHVRVDIFHARFRLRTKAWVELFGILLFLTPFIYFILRYSIPFVERAYSIGEVSDAPGGLPMRWLIKAALPAAFCLLALSTLSRLLRVTALLFGLPRPRRPQSGDLTP